MVGAMSYPTIFRGLLQSRASSATAPRP